MRIAVNARFLLADRLEGIGWYSYHLLSRLTRAHPEHEFVFFFDRPYDPRFVFAENVTPLVLRPPARHPVLWYWWFEHSVRRALAACRADVFFSPDAFLSLRAATPTVLTVHDLAFEHFQAQLGALPGFYCRTFTPKFAHRADTIVAVSELTKRDLVDTYAVPAEKIEVIPCAAGPAFRPLSSHEQEAVRASVAGGAPFFLHVGAIQPRKNVARLLRAFDRFKDTTDSPTKLLLMGRLAWRYRDVLRAHAAMRHRDDVVFLSYRPLDELARIMASALAVVSVSLYEGFGLPVLEAMASDVPVIAAPQAAADEVTGDATLRVDPLVPASIAEALCRIQIDAELRDTLVRRGRERARQFDWDRSAAALWRVLSATAAVSRTQPSV